MFHTFIICEAYCCYVLGRELYLGKKIYRDGSMKSVLSFLKSIFLRLHIPRVLRFLSADIYTTTLLLVTQNSQDQPAQKIPSFLCPVPTDAREGVLTNPDHESPDLICAFPILGSKITQICQPFWYTI